MATARRIVLPINPPRHTEDTMNTSAATVEWTAPQACAECGTEAAYIRAEHGEALCRVCGHENPMDRWNLDAGEAFEWVGGEHAEWPAVLYVTRYDWTEDETSAYV